MADVYPNLVRAIEARLDDGLLQQESIGWSSKTWLKWFQMGSPEGVVLQGLVGQPLSRSSILDTAEGLINLPDDQRKLGVEHLFLRSQVWGFGTVGYGAYRTSRIMSLREFKPTISRAFEVLHDEGAVVAYESMRPGGENYLRGLGPAFATKFLYFAGYRLLPPKALKPLILDSLVGAALHTAEPSVFGPRAGRAWDRGAYKEYLEAARWAMAHSTKYVLLPEDTERVLFEMGKELRTGKPPS